MKKFSFQLDKVLSYKMQVESSLRGEYARAVQASADQELLIEKLRKTCLENERKMDEEKKKECVISELLVYTQFIENISNRIKREEGILEMLREIEEEKRQAVIEAKTETASISKLKEKKRMEYDKMVQKEEERLVEEFVVNTMASR